MNDIIKVEHTNVCSCVCKCSVSGSYCNYSCLYICGFRYIITILAVIVVILLLFNYETLWSNRGCVTSVVVQVWALSTALAFLPRLMVSVQACVQGRRPGLGHLVAL